METKTMEQLEVELSAITDQVGRLIDQVQQKGYVPVFQCGHSGLYFPSDYVKNWGRIYGIGLGSDPVSEVLDSDYFTAPPAITPEIRDIRQIMHPLVVSRAQVDFLMMAPDQVEGKYAVLVKDDKNLEARTKIVMEKQIKNPMAGGLAALHADWTRLKKGSR